MTMAIEGGWDGATAASRARVVIRGASRERSASASSEATGETPVVRYLYDEDGRILAEAIVGPEGN